MNEETTARFIEVVQNNECLWSVTSKAFKNKLLREDLWKSIGVDFKMTGDEAYGHFRSLREKYRREKEKGHSKSGAAASKPSKWIFLKNLEFLDDAYKRRKVSSSQSWSNSTANESLLSEQDEDSESPQLESPQLESQQQPIKQCALSRSRSKTPGALNALVNAMKDNTAKMLGAMKTDSPIDTVLAFVKDTYNELEKDKAKEFERKIMDLSMQFRYSK